MADREAGDHGACPICAHHLARPHLTVGDHQYLVCAGCGAVRLHPFPLAQDAADLYDDSYFMASSHGGYHDYPADASIHRRNARGRLRKLGPPPRSGAVLIDVGCAYGFTLLEAQQAGWRPMGVDVNATARVAVSELGFPVSATLADLNVPLGTVDAITFFQVLEHLPDPVGALREARELLAPNGRVLVETWDRNSRIARVMKAHWQQATPPSVLWLFDEAVVAQMCELAGLEVAEWRPSAKWVSVGLVAGQLDQRGSRSARHLGRRLRTLAVPYALGDLVTARIERSADEPALNRSHRSPARPASDRVVPMEWAVVGAGVLGMRLSQRLADEGHSVTLIEAASQTGGLAAPWKLGDITWDRHYHVTLLSDRRTRAMYESLGLDDVARWVETKTGYFGPDRTMRSVSNVLEFLQLPGMTTIGKLRLGATIVYGSRIRKGVRMESLTVETWLRRWSGTSTFEALWKPLLRAKLGDQYTKTSAAFIWATIQRLYAARRSGMKREMFGYVPGGYASVCSAFDRWFEQHGVTVRTATKVTNVSRTTSGEKLAVTMRAADGTPSTDEFDRVAVTLAAPLAASLCTDLLPAERARLSNVDYVGIVCVSLLLRRPLAEYYLTYITEPETPFTAVVEMTALIDPVEVGGHSLVYLPKYTTADDVLFTMPDEAVIAQFLPYLRSMYGNLADDDIVTARVSKVPQVFAIPSLGYSARSPSISTSVPGLYLAGSANLPFSTLNVDDTLSLVDEVMAVARPTVAPAEH